MPDPTRPGPARPGRVNFLPPSTWTFIEQRKRKRRRCGRRGAGRQQRAPTPRRARHGRRSGERSSVLVLRLAWAGNADGDICTSSSSSSSGGGGGSSGVVGRRPTARPVLAAVVFVGHATAPHEKPPTGNCSDLRSPVADPLGSRTRRRYPGRPSVRPASVVISGTPM